MKQVSMLGKKMTRTEMKAIKGGIVPRNCASDLNRGWVCRSPGYQNCCYADSWQCVSNCPSFSCMLAICGEL